MDNTVLGAGKQRVLCMYNARKVLCVFLHGLHIHGVGYVLAAVADKNSNLGLFAFDIACLGEGLLPGLGVTGNRQE